jgi:hypothetical protein
MPEIRQQTKPNQTKPNHSINHNINIGKKAYATRLVQSISDICVPWTTVMASRLIRQQATQEGMMLMDGSGDADGW